VEGKSDTTAHRSAPTARIAWLVTFVVPLILAALLLGVKSAQAAQIGPAVTPFAFEEEFEFEEEDEFEYERCELAEEEFEEGELSEAEVERICEEDNGDDKKKANASDSAAPEECLLKSARPHLVVYGSRNMVRLTIGYTTYEPAAAAVDYSAAGGRGSLDLGTAKRHLGGIGVIRLAKRLSDADMAKVEAAGHFTVRLDVAEAPGDCRRYEIERLTVKHVSKRQVVWSQTD
jgi:hypothetical protein